MFLMEVPLNQHFGYFTDDAARILRINNFLQKIQNTLAHVIHRLTNKELHLPIIQNKL